MQVNGPYKRFLVFKVIKILFHRDEGWKSTHISSWKTESNSHCIFFLINDAHRREKEEGWMEGGREGTREEDGALRRGERVEVGGDEWEWWVYWVLSGWVDAG